MSQTYKPSNQQNTPGYGGYQQQQTQHQAYQPQPYQSQGQRQVQHQGLDVFGKALDFLEFAVDAIKAGMVVLGVISVNLLDVVMGGIAMSVLFGGNIAQFKISPSLLGTTFSLGATAIQIFLWTMIRKNYTISEIFNFKKLSSDVRMFVIGAGLVWFVDTMMDVSPLVLLIENSQYEKFPPVYYMLIFCATILVFMLCGLAEILTSNMKEMLRGKQKTAQNVMGRTARTGNP